MIKNFKDFINESQTSEPLMNLTEFVTRKGMALDYYEKTDPAYKVLLNDYTTVYNEIREFFKSKDPGCKDEDIICLSHDMSHGPECVVKVLNDADDDNYEIIHLWYKSSDEIEEKRMKTGIWADVELWEIELNGNVFLKMTDEGSFHYFFCKKDELLSLLEQDLLDIQNIEPFLTSEEKRKYSAQIFAKKHNL